MTADQKRAPWVEIAIREAKKWAGKNEKEITKTSNYHRMERKGAGFDTLVGDKHPWCAFL